ncbi:MAG: mechanosensitive ion channel family protein [Candidatus Krumholzibacteria bacterium]|nr:mechanosensitive ion channel family protein [Candidatus Krumholzibacteria bacterium]MDH5270038.1 mechanosensitive ion channel family protein [Candidatus Krumholzibacteria bacterium]
MTWKILVTAMLLIAGGAFATNPAAQPNDAFTAEADSALAKLDRARAEIRGLTSRLNSLAGEDSLVIFRRRASILIAALDDVKHMADIVVRQEQAGGDASRLRAYLADIQAPIPAALDFMRTDLTKQLGVVENGARRAPAAELRVLETDIADLNAELDGIYGAKAKYIAIYEQVGDDVAAERSKLVRHISERAELLSGKLRLAMENRQKYSKRAMQKTADTRSQEAATAAQNAIDNYVASLERISTTMSGLGLDVTEYRTLLVEATGELFRGLGDRKVALSLLERGLVRLRDWLMGEAPGLVLKLIIFAIIVFAFRILGRLARKAVVRSLDKSPVQTSQLMRSMVSKVVKNLILLFGILVALSQFGVSLSPLLAGLGVAGFIVGFALQDTLANFASGVMILFYKPFDKGDAVEAGGVTGVVSHMSLVSTTILTFDNQTIIVPNSKIWGDVIKNINTQDRRRVDLKFGISYSDDIPRAEAVLMEIVKAHPNVLETPEPVVRLHELGDSSVNFVVRPWVVTTDYWEVYWDLTRTVKMRFDKEGISIPFPQRDVHLYTEGPGAGAAGPGGADAGRGA